jgi:hypothetical protein
MTENEKLRALLAEARVITQDSLDSNTTGFEADNEVCKCTACERYRSIIARIDAALAEPVDDYDIDADLRQHKEDRLRLRAENMRLTREAVGAFKAGAEAMREKAADYIKNNIVGDQASMILAAKVYEKEIRALPIPEDE